MSSHFQSGSKETRQLGSVSTKDNRIVKKSAKFLSLIALIFIIICGTTACMDFSSNSGKLASFEEKALVEAEKQVKSVYYTTYGRVAEVTSKALYVHDNGKSTYNFIVGVHITGYNTFVLCHVGGYGNMELVSVHAVTKELSGSSLDNIPQSVIDEAKVMWKID